MNNRATKRLGRDGAAMRLEELAALLGLPATVLVRWAVRGKRGAKLDAVRCGGEWFSSWKAVERFRQATGKGERAGELVKRVARAAAASPASEGTREPQSSLAPSCC